MHANLATRLLQPDAFLSFCYLSISLHEFLKLYCIVVGTLLEIQWTKICRKLPEIPGDALAMSHKALFKDQSHKIDCFATDFQLKIYL